MRLIRGIIAPEVCLNLCLFHFYTEFYIFHASFAVGQGKQSVKLSRFPLSKVQILHDADLIFVSETQTAECRSSKPDVAGSIPVAHSKIIQLSKARSFNRQNGGLQNRNFQFKS